MKPVSPKDFLDMQFTQKDLDKMRPDYWWATWWRRAYVTLRWSRRIDFVCWFSKYFWDIHDYNHWQGRDGVPCHMVAYRCWNCGKEFYI